MSNSKSKTMTDIVILDKSVSTEISSSELKKKLKRRMVVIDSKFVTMGKVKSLYISFVPHVDPCDSHIFIEKSPKP